MCVFSAQPVILRNEQAMSCTILLCGVPNGFSLGLAKRGHRRALMAIIHNENRWRARTGLPDDSIKAAGDAQKMNIP
jgi:hypothetical protein